MQAPGPVCERDPRSREAVIYHPEASAEFEAAAERYESLSVGLGESFVDEVEAIVARIEESPVQFPVWQGNPRFRKAVLPETFPYVVFFRELNDCIRILAVAHGARKPGYWARRK